MDAISYKEIPLAHQLACEVLELSGIDELDYSDVNHVIALSLAVNEVFARKGAGATGYWENIYAFYRDNDIYNEIYSQVCENSLDEDDFNIYDYFDVDNIALFTMSYVKNELNIDKGYFNTDLTGQVADIVCEWQELKREKLADEISDFVLSVTEDRTIFCWEKLYSYGYHYSNEDFSSELRYIFNTDIYSCEESPFLSALVLSFPDIKGVFPINREINTALAFHFKVFRDAYMFSLLDEMIESDLYSLTYESMMTKLFRKAFYEGSKTRQDYFFMVSSVIENFSREMKLTGEDEMNCVTRAFFVTAVKGNPLVLSASDFTPQHVILFSKLLRDVLLEYRQRFERCYERIMNMGG